MENTMPTNHWVDPAHPPAPRNSHWCIGPCALGPVASLCGTSSLQTHQEVGAPTKEWMMMHWVLSRSAKLMMHLSWSIQPHLQVWIHVLITTGRPCNLDAHHPDALESQCTNQKVMFLSFFEVHPSSRHAWVRWVSSGLDWRMFGMS